MTMRRAKRTGIRALYTVTRFDEEGITHCGYVYYCGKTRISNHHDWPSIAKRAQRKFFKGSTK